MQSVCMRVPIVAPQDYNKCENGEALKEQRLEERRAQKALAALEEDDHHAFSK